MNLFTDPTLLAARQQQRHSRFTADFPSITWDEVLRCLDFSVRRELLIRTTNKFGIVVHDVRASNSLRQVLADYAQLDVSARASAHLYISLSGDAETFGWHQDTMDVVYWQAIGLTDFSVDDGGVIKYTMQPGDAIYVPRGMRHTTKPLGPRCGVSLGLEK